MELTISVALQLLEEAVAEGPKGEDTIYSVDIEPHSKFCHYVVDGQPGCLVGRVFAKLGATLGQLESLDSITGGMSASSVAAQDMFNAHYPSSAHDALWVLRNAQQAQDTGNTWGQAIEQARQTASRYAMNAQVAADV